MANEWSKRIKEWMDPWCRTEDGWYGCLGFFLIVNRCSKGMEMPTSGCVVVDVLCWFGFLSLVVFGGFRRWAADGAPAVLVVLGYSRHK